MAGLLFWGLPGVAVLGPKAVLYTLAAVLPVWLFSLRMPMIPPIPLPRFGTTTCVILVGGSMIYLITDALFGQKLFQANLFLVGTESIDRVMAGVNAGVGEGRGAVALLGTLTMLLPFCLIDTAERAPRYGRWALWTAAILLIFYNVTSSRGQVLFAVAAIVLARTSNWRRIAVAGALALSAFSLASVLRGDYGNPGSPLAAGIASPFLNLLLMLTSHCGSAPWYTFILEFLKKFIPGFVFPKSVFSFNVEMSWCIDPTGSRELSAVSIFTWLGEVVYYRPSVLTALAAGILLGSMGRIVDRQLVKSRLFSSRMWSGFACIMMLRSRVLDVMSFLIAQWVFLFIWPYIAELARSLRFLVTPREQKEAQPKPYQEFS
jgi:hypothetical protein